MRIAERFRVTATVQRLATFTNARHLQTPVVYLMDIECQGTKMQDQKMLAGVWSEELRAGDKFEFVAAIVDGRIKRPRHAQMLQVAR